MASEHESRLQRFATELTEAGYDAFLACTPVTMGYLHGFFEGAGERFMTLAIRDTGEVRMICPALSATQASKAGIRNLAPWRDGEDPMDLFRQLADDWALRSAVIAVDDEMPAKMLLDIEAVLPAALYRPGGEVLSRLMRSKDPNELATMREAGRIVDEAFPAAMAALKPGASELDVQRALTDEIRRSGGEPTFCIVAAGPNSAEPHHLTDGTLIQAGNVVIVDYGCSVGGYQADITRTVCVGSASDEARQVYALVHRAHQAACAAVRPGVACESVDRAARKVIEEAGYGEKFMHRTGHGIGMRVHEEPYIVEGNHLPLETGHCFSVEPGVYLPGQFGVRIETIMTVGTAQGESLNADPSPVLIEVPCAGPDQG